MSVKHLYSLKKIRNKPMQSYSDEKNLKDRFGDYYQIKGRV